MDQEFENFINLSFHQQSNHRLPTTFEWNNSSNTKNITNYQNGSSSSISIPRLNPPNENNNNNNNSRSHKMMRKIVTKTKKPQTIETLIQSVVITIAWSTV